ncbi:hypothetical protein MNBD_PLANCTO03-271 [hydrothermal vent metagenome]|uniref:Outer membrane lipoprotein-sorting protein n=1 Tax=hydrothermal vent metagenome TaxID=652676 RepID=A0A3B1DA98_9ZZZZ
MRTRSGLLTIVFTAIIAAVLPGCAAPGGGVRFDQPEVMPTYDEVASRFNTRVERLNRVWARVNLTLHSPKESGGTNVDRAEGYLQLEQPDRTSLSIMKLGETYFYMGSDATGYWWLDMSDSETKTALYGTHADATPELVMELGLPVHPRELLDLIGITPLPVRADGERGSPGRVDWDRKRGLLRVESPAMWGTRVLWLNPVTMAPQRVELRDGRGVVRASCDMGRYISAPVRGDGRVPPKLASQYKVEMPTTGVRATLELYGAQNKPINPRAFDFADLVESYGIDEVYFLRPTRDTGGE